MEADECTISFHHSQVLARFRTSEEHQRILHKVHGTKVTVRDLFGKLPVRVKHRAIQYELQESLDKEFEHFKRRIVALLLAWSRPAQIVLSDAEKNRRCLLRLNPQSLLHSTWDSQIKVIAKIPFRLDWICPLLVQAGCISHTCSASWVTASARTSTTSIRAAISLEPAPTKQVQFFSFGIRPVDSTHGGHVLFDEVNRMFALSSFGACEEDIETSENDNSRGLKDKRYNTAEYSTQQLKVFAKGADRWPMFYIRVDSNSHHEILDEDQAQTPAGEAARVVQKVLQLVKTMIYQFLEEHHFRPRARRRKSRKNANGIPYERNSFSDPLIQPSNQVSSESADYVPSSARMDPIPNVSRLQRHMTRQFDNWSRVKSGKRDAFEHILSGLPRSKSFRDDLRPATAPAAFTYARNTKFDIGHFVLAQPQSQIPLDDDIQLLFQDLDDEGLSSDSGDEKANNGTRPSTVRTVDVPLSEEKLHDSPLTDEGILWTNPTTGQVVRISSRTGLILPDQQENDSDIEASEGQSTGSTRKIASILKTKPVRSLRRTGKTLASKMHVPSESWIGDLFACSGMSVFRQLEGPIYAVAPEEAIMNGEIAPCRHSKLGHDRLKQVSTAFDAIPGVSRGRLSKSGLTDAQVLAQVDRKFILVKLITGQTRASINGRSDQPSPEETHLVLIDQHAADERCQVEALYEELCNRETVQLLAPVYFEVPAQEIRLFQMQKDFFTGWGFCYDTQIGPEYGFPRHAARRLQSRVTTQVSEDNCRIVVTALPKVVAERCRLDPKILIDLLRTEIWARDENGSAKARTKVSRVESQSGQSNSESSSSCEKRWLSNISSCPRGLIEMVNSRACRSAIMFNDTLSQEECAALVKRLAKCSFPFQCAHGRPSMVVLGGLGTLDAGLGRPLGLDNEQEGGEGGGEFAKAFDSWQANF